MPRPSDSPNTLSKCGLSRVPSDPDADIVFRAEHLSDPGLGATEGFDLRDYRVQPRRDRISLLLPAQGVVVSEPKRSDAALALVLAELKRLQRQRRNRFDQGLLGRSRDKVFGIPKPFGTL